MAIALTTDQEVAEITRLLQSVSNTIDQPAPRASQAVTLGIKIFHLGQTYTEKERRAVLACLTLCGRSSDDRYRAWQTFNLTYLCLSYPGLVEPLTAARLADYTLEQIPPAFVHECVGVFDSYQRNPIPEFSAQIAMPPALPQVPDLRVDVDLIAGSEILNLYAYAALVMFLCGKNITAENRTAVTERRPMALINRFSLQTPYVLTGPGRISDEGHSRVHSAWVRSTGPRIVIVRYFAHMVTSPSEGMTVEIMANIMNLLKYSNAAFVWHIYLLLQAHPWVIRQPALCASYAHFKASVEHLATHPNWFKPYYKLAYQDTTQYFLRRHMEPLIAVAVYWARQSNVTLSNFVVPNATQPAVDAFIAEARARNINLIPATNQATVSQAN